MATGATPVVANGSVYSPITSTLYDGTLYAAETGVVLGTFSADVAPAVTSTTAYMLQSQTLRSIAVSNNQVNWSFAGDGALVTSPIVVNNYVFVGSSNGNLYALDATTGAQVWSKSLGAATPASPGYAPQLPYTGPAAGLPEQLRLSPVEFVCGACCANQHTNTARRTTVLHGMATATVGSGR